MTPAAIIREAQSEGVRLRLSATGTIKATGNGAAVNRWLGVIRENKAAIVEALKVDGGLPLDAFSFWWRLNFPGGVQREICVPSGDTHAQMLARYPAALKVEPFALGTVKPNAPLTEGDKRSTS